MKDITKPLVTASETQKTQNKLGLYPLTQTSEPLATCLGVRGWGRITSKQGPMREKTILQFLIPSTQHPVKHTVVLKTIGCVHKPMSRHLVTELNLYCFGINLFYDVRHIAKGLIIYFHLTMLLA